ncbi:HAD-IA family hydrolase [Amnibacterium sp.]|uniref:HAD-IA family hydrolase n=1 Tax=Amnibacterium sp. TaxID=1872496 RepID=UPI002603ED69|nr:HAD-IA family hydrolase [Amnibacterium sp.]MCU1474015.1 phosphatase [Amnibacterium sp.]
MPIVRAVLFDLDGTLIGSTPAVARSWARWGEQWGVGDVFASHEHGRPAREIVAGHVPADQVDAAFASIEALEMADTEGIVVLPGARELLDALPRDAWAIVTSCSRPLAYARLAAVGLEPPVLVTASDTAVGKPAPDPFLEAARRLGVDPVDCLVVEDAPAGVAAGRAAGATTLAVEGTVDRALLDADLVAPDLRAVAVEPLRDGIRVTLREPRS